MIISMLLPLSSPLIHTGSTELNESVLDEVALEHFATNTNDAYGTNNQEVTTMENVAYTTTGDAIPVRQNVAYEQMPPGTDDPYDYVNCDEY